MSVDKDGKFRWGKSDPSLEFPEIVPMEPNELEPVKRVYNVIHKNKMEEVVDAIEIVRTKFPRIYKRIEATWGSIELDNYFNKLIVDDRGDREGFPKDVLEALLTLAKTNVSELMKDGIVIDKYKNNPWINFSYK